MASNPKCSFFITSLLSFFLLSSALDMSVITYDNESNTTLPGRAEGEVLALYESWLVKHGKAYNAIGEKERRFKIFKDNLKFIDEHNSEDHSYKVGLNQFADLTNEEFQTMYLTPRSHRKFLPLSGQKASSVPFGLKDCDDEVPDSIDWREKGAVGPVRNQGSCASGSWAFSAVAALESANQIATGNLTSLSVQQLLDCDAQSRGCSGGSVTNAFEYLMQSAGIYTEDSYPYKGRPGYCKKGQKAPSTVDGFTLFYGDYKMLQKAVAYQPISTSINAGDISFQFYKTGIYNGKCGTRFQQVVTTVGYELGNGTSQYYIAQNSWGAEWGEGGFVKLGGTQGYEYGSWACNYGEFEKIMPFMIQASIASTNIE